MSVECNWIFFYLTAAPTNSNYWVLGTDYTTYSIVWSCSNFALFNTRKLLRNVVWILHMIVGSFLVMIARFMQNSCGFWLAIGNPLPMWSLQLWPSSKQTAWTKIGWESLTRPIVRIKNIVQEQSKKNS